MDKLESAAKVLVVDDRPDVADALGCLVRSLGHPVRVAYDPDTALELARAMRPDIAIIDVAMGDADGGELAAQLRAEAHGRGVRVIGISGYDIDSDRLDGKPQFDDFLTKPPELDALLRVLTDSRDTRRDR